MGAFIGYSIFILLFIAVFIWGGIVNGGILIFALKMIGIFGVLLLVVVAYCLIEAHDDKKRKENEKP